MGNIEVPEDAYDGAQTARSLIYFNIGNEMMPMSVVPAIALIKYACAEVNRDLGLITKEIIEGKFDNHFPLNVWQTGFWLK